MSVGLRVLVTGALTLILASCASPEPTAEETTTTTTEALTTTSVPAPTTTTTEAMATTLEAAATERQFGLVEPFTIVIPPEWSRDENSASDQLFINAGANGFFFGTEGPETTVDSWVQRLTDHPNLITTEPMPAEVGGASGQVLDVRLGAGAPQRGCPGEPCVNVVDGGLGWHILNGLPNRIWIVDVDGTAVMIAAEATEDSFESHLASIAEALDTLVWVEE